MHVSINLHHYHSNEHNREHNVIVFDYPTRAYDNGRVLDDIDDDASLIDEFLNEFFDKYPNALDRVIRRVHHAAETAAIVHDAADDDASDEHDDASDDAGQLTSKYLTERVYYSPAHRDVDQADAAGDAPDPSNALTTERLRSRMEDLQFQVNRLRRRLDEHING